MSHLITASNSPSVRIYMPSLLRLPYRLVCKTPALPRRTPRSLLNRTQRNLFRTMSESPKTLTINSTVKLSSGYDLPLLGFGVYQNDDATPAVLEALKAGYRHVDSAQMYRNEAQVRPLFI